MKQDKPGKYKQDLNELLPLSDTSFKKVSCPSCSQVTPADNININDKIAKCNECDTVFSFEKEIIDLLEMGDAKQEVIRPEGIDLFHFQGELEITMKQPIAVVEGVFGTLFPLLATLFSVMYFMIPGAPILVLIIPWLIGFPFLFNLVYRSLQKMYIIVDDQDLSILRKPRSLVKDQHFAISEIDQLYVKSVQGGICDIYLVVNGANGQKHVKLISHMKSMSKARYLEQEIEKYLGIEDRRIPEETSK